MNTDTIERLRSDAIARIRAWAAERKIPKSRLALDAGLHANTLRGFDGSDWNPQQDTLRKLEALMTRIESRQGKSRKQRAA